MKKYILALFLFFSVLVSNFNVFAQQVLEDIDPTPTKSACVDLKNNIRQRDRDQYKAGEVLILQDFLQSNGYLRSEPTGYFGMLTFEAVKDFQKANGMNPTGYVGVNTKAKIKALTCGEVKGEQKFAGYLSPIGPNIQQWGTHTLSIEENVQCIKAPCYPVKKSYPVKGKDATVASSLKLYENSQVTVLGQLVWNNLEGGFYGILASKVVGSTTPVPIPPITSPSLTVSSPNGGESWVKGTTKAITWKDNTPIPPCPTGAFCSPPAPKFYDINLTTYQQPCTSNVCSMRPTIMPVPYIIASQVTGSSYNWLVGNIMSTGSGNGAGFSTSASIDTDFGLPDGSYTVQVCQSGTNICDSSNSYFKITSQTPPPAPSLKVTSPNGGETLKQKSTQVITWQDNTVCSSLDCGMIPKNHTISLVSYRAPCKVNCPLYPDMAPYVIANNVSTIGNAGSYSWSVGTYLVSSTGVSTPGQVAPATKAIVPDGSYTVQICQSGTSTCDSSDSYFKIVSSTTLPYVCDYAAPPVPCRYVPGPNYNSTTQCGMVLDCSDVAPPVYPGSVLGAWSGDAYGQYSSTPVPIPPTYMYPPTPVPIPPVSTNDCNAFTMILRKGIKHREVRCLQRLLNERGFLVAGIANGFETEYFGESTLSALKAFQKNMGLVDDGIAGPKTLKILLGQ